MRLAEAVVCTLPAKTGSTKPSVAVQSVVVPLGPLTMNDPLASAREAVRGVSDVLDPGGGPVKDAFDNAIEAVAAGRELLHVGAELHQHCAIISSTAFLGDGLGLIDGLMTGDRFKLEVAGIDFGVDIGIEIVSRFLAQVPHGQVVEPAARLVVSIVKFAAPAAVAAFERARAQAKDPVPTLPEQLLRFYSAQVTGADDASNAFSYRPLSALSPAQENDVVFQPWRALGNSMLTELPITKPVMHDHTG